MRRFFHSPFIFLPPVTLVSLILALALLSCGRSESGGSNGTTLRDSNPARWYLLRRGRFQPVEHPPSMGSKSLLPWTIQERVTDFTLFRGSLYMSLNGYGAAGIRLNRSDGKPQFRYFSHPEALKQRTIARIFPLRDSLLLHFYYNTILNTRERKSIYPKALNLLKLIPDEDRHRIVPMVPPFQKEHPEWELVSFLPARGEHPGEEHQFYLEWKYPGDEYTRFAYSALDRDGNRETAISREEFRNAWEPERGYSYAPGYPEEGRLPEHLLEAVLKRLPEKDSLLLFVRSDGTPFIRRIRIGPEGDSTNVPEEIGLVRLFEMRSPGDNGRGGQASWFALLPDGSFIYAHPEKSTNQGYGENRIAVGGVREIPLPGREQGISFTDFFVREGNLVLSWEAADFFRVGPAGLLFYRLPPN